MVRFTVLLFLLLLSGVGAAVAVRLSTSLLL